MIREVLLQHQMTEILQGFHHRIVIILSIMKISHKVLFKVNKYSFEEKINIVFLIRIIIIYTIRLLNFSNNINMFLKIKI